MLTNRAKLLPDSFRKDSQSNNSKILSIDTVLQEDFSENMTKVYESLDIYNAIGSTLDLYGDSVGQKRQGLTDEQYRVVILAKIARNVANTDYNSILNILAMVLSCNVRDIQLENGTNVAAIRIVKIPIEVLINAGFTATDATKLLNTLLPITVTIEEANFQGTFEFGNTDIEVVASKGFSNLTQTTGGYFGMLMS